MNYNEDIAAWAIEQARFLRNRQFEQLDIENIADALEDVAKAEQRELAERLASLLALTLTNLTGHAYEAEKMSIRYLLHESPSLATKFSEPRWRELVQAKALAQVDQPLDVIQKAMDEVLAHISAD